MNQQIHLPEWIFYLEKYRIYWYLILPSAKSITTTVFLALFLTVYLILSVFATDLKD